MITLENTSKYSAKKSESFGRYFGNLSAAFLDIETTGLSPERCKIILTGFAVPEDDCISTYQFLAEDPSEEPLVLKRSLDFMRELDIAVTYNGKSFDIPFIEKRCRKNRIHMGDVLPYNLDIYQVLRHFSPLYGFLPNLRQKTVENFLGLWSSRLDEISGSESVDLYYHYASTGDEKIRDIILLHNRDDVEQLAKLTQILERCDLPRYLYTAGFPCRGNIVKARLDRGLLRITGMQKNHPVNLSYFDDFNTGIRAEYDEYERTLMILIPVINEPNLTVCDLSGLPSEEEYLLLRNGDELLYDNIIKCTEIITGYVQGA